MTYSYEMSKALSGLRIGFRTICSQNTITHRTEKNRQADSSQNLSGSRY